MRVVVTGGNGAIGRFVVRRLTGQAPDPAGIPGAARTNPNRPGTRATSASDERHEVVVFGTSADTSLPGGVDATGVRHVRGDIRDLGQVYGVLHGADAVIHLAAVRRPGIVPDDVVFSTNVLGTFNVHEAAWRLGVRRVISTSSEAALGWDYRRHEFVPDYLPIDEDHPARPQDPYGLSKVAGEAIAASYARRGLETLVLRVPWVVMPDRLAGLYRDGGRKLSRFGTASYIDVRDLAEAYRLALDAPRGSAAAGQVLFVVADDPSIAEPLCSFMPRMLPEIGELAAGLVQGMPAVSNERAREALGWRPRHSWRRAEAAIGQADGGP